VGDVDAGHQEVVAPDAGHAAALGGAAVHGDVLAERVAVADLEGRVLARVGALLRVPAEDGEGVHHVARAEARPGADHGVGVQHGVRAEAHAGLDDGEGADGDAGLEPSFGGDEGQGMDDGRGHGWRSTMEASSSPSAQSAPSTLASPRSFQTLERWWSTSTRRSSLSPGVTTWRNFALSMPRKNIRFEAGSNGSEA